MSICPAICFQFLLIRELRMLRSIGSHVFSMTCLTIALFSEPIDFQWFMTFRAQSSCSISVFHALQRYQFISHKQDNAIVKYINMHDPKQLMGCIAC